MDETTRRLIAHMLSDANTLMDGYYLGHYDVATWEQEMARLITKQHIATYLAMRDMPDYAPDADRIIGQRIQEQLDYLHGFANDLDGMSEAAARARAQLYAGALKATSSRARYWLWDLPYHPTEGTECMTNDQCHWELTVWNEEELDGDAYWTLGDAEHCPTCITRAARNPYQFRGGELQ